ncbi:YheC/YheD family protein [Pseudalkalibacillus berkeleyi]|uniref:YheC/YheD family protein n=1 Tax=Pseudalkalibacillus berkeleyi TaxID=1069813 RepID=A0ABS9GWQ8_9BACL|nr:YheC/YheD family protein [Pseudalkalibacillus berkeleyi]MCF6136151.1 YheC/YheD family protein [Pseudalkalibacillus berkeleyi]
MSNLHAISVTKGNADTLFVPISLFRKWYNNQSFPTKLKYGHRLHDVHVQPHPDQKELYMVTESLRENLALLENQSHHIYEQNGIIHVGPVVGIYTAGFTNHLQQPFGERSKMFAKMLIHARKQGVTCYVFGSNHINWDRQEVYGYLYKKTGWVRSTLPLPNIIYDRLPNRKIEALPSTVETNLKLQAMENLLWFNPGFFDKWTVYDYLMKDRTIQKYLPESLFSPDYKSIERMLNRYKNVYVKPSSGSLGNGIQQILRRKNDPYYYIRFRHEDCNRLRRYSSLKRLLHKQFPNGLKGYIAQQGIHLVNCNGNAIDFRVHTNRGRNGDWEVSAIAAKLAGTGSITTHITSGGKTLTLSEIIHDLGQSQKIVQEIKTAALLLSEALSSRHDELIGEIGFDIGIDEKGSVWLFEANSKPGRSIFQHPNMNAYDRKTLSLPFAFSIYLFEQNVLNQVAVKQ